MEPATYPDPVGDSISHSAQLAAQIVSLSVAAAQGYVIFRAHRAAISAAEDEQALRALRDQERRACQAARLGWAPALDPAWLAGADLIQTARAWGAAAPYADADATAASAMRAAEARLRALHPYAMNRYDRLRADGLSPADAMIETAPFFTRHPFAREGASGRSPGALTPGPGTERRGPGPGNPSPPGQAANGPTQTSNEAEAVLAAGHPAGPEAAHAAGLAALNFPTTVSQALTRAPGTRPQDPPAVRTRPASRAMHAGVAR